MDTETIVALGAAGFGALSTIVLVVLMVWLIRVLGRGQRSLSDIRTLLNRPPHNHL